MTVENFLAIVGLLCTVVCYAGYRWCGKNTYLKYKEQRVGGLKK